MPVPAEKVPPGWQAVQPVVVPSEQLAHEGSQAWQVLLASAYLLDGQPATHAPSSAYGVPLVGHEVQLVEEAPLHVAHEPWHVEQVPWLPTNSTNPPTLGHSATHSPLERKGVEALVQLRQFELPGPVHVPHEEWQGSHTLLALAYFPAVVHEARQLPGGSKNGVAEAQEVHSLAAGPVQMAQLASHATQLSAAVALPPAHVYPSSIAEQSPLQPSSETVLPSSHASEPTRLPSPHTATHVSLPLKWPPEHVKPGSIWHVGLHPSPAIVLLSSHVSYECQRMRRPSPQRGRQLSTPPTPEPSVTDELHSKPTSMRHSESQPSAPIVLLSSQLSAVLRMPLPQMWTGGT